MNRMFRTLKPVLALGFIVGLLLAWRHPALQPYTSWEGLQAHWALLQEWSRQPWALVALLGVSTLAVVVSFPQMILIAVLSLLFSPWIAAAISLLGCTLGGAITFLLGRWFFRDVLLQFAERRQKMAMLTALEQGGFKYVLFLRFAFFMFFALNWLPGATKIRMRDYLLATALGALPWIAVLVLMVDKLQTGDLSAAGWLVVPAILVVAVALVRRRLAKAAAVKTASDPQNTQPPQPT